jgi:hypothetical protein
VPRYEQGNCRIQLAGGKGGEVWKSGIEAKGRERCDEELEENITREAIYVECNTEVRSRNHFCCGKPISIIYTEGVLVALGTQHAMRMRSIIHCHYLLRVWLYHVFFTLSHKRHDFRGTNLWNIHVKCSFWFSLQLLSEIFFVVRRTERNIIINVHRSACEVPVIFMRFQWNLNFLIDNTQTSNFLKVHPVGALFYADGRTDMTKLIVTWRSWICASWYNYENNQQGALYRLIYYSMSALHVSGDVFVHHQEHLTVFTVSRGLHPSCCRLVSRMDFNAFETPAGTNLDEH